MDAPCRLTELDRERLHDASRASAELEDLVRTGAARLERVERLARAPRRAQRVPVKVRLEGFRPLTIAAGVGTLVGAVVGQQLARLVAELVLKLPG